MSGFGYNWLGFGGGVSGPSQEFPSATGGTITTVQTDYKLHTFTADGEFVFTAGYDTTYGDKVQFLMVAGGGGGGNTHSGGGGGGGYLYNGGYQHTLTDGSTYPVVIGAEGQGGTAGPNNATNGGAATFDTLSAAGGGRSGNFASALAPEANAPYDGGSGGGAGGGTATGAEGNVPDVTPTYPSQGYDGGPATSVHPYYTGGGGGGAGSVGETGAAQAGGGGDGSTASPIDATGRAGGASGGAQNGPTGGAKPNPNPQGGPDGGGQGGIGIGQGTPDGTDNKGGGGGGAWAIAPNNVGGSGGTGIVLIQYKFQ